MTHSWQIFLGPQQAHFEDDKLLDFGDPVGEHAAINQQTVISSLLHKSIIEISGEDAQHFLHGQFSNSLNDINENKCQLSSYSSAKGRLYAIFRLYQLEQRYYLILPKSLSASLIKRLNMFKLRAKVQITDVSEQMGIIGIAGSNAIDILTTHFNEIPTAVDAVTYCNDCTLLQSSSLTPRFEIVAKPEILQTLWIQLRTEALPVGEDAWERLNIMAGIPTIYPETSEEFVAQMVNLDSLNGINFKKGCYPGQEIIARMHYLGKLKRKMYRVQLQSNANHPAPGTLIHDSHTAQSVGVIVDARRAPDGYVDALAVIQIDSTNSDCLYIANHENHPIAIQTLPYTVT